VFALNSVSIECTPAWPCHVRQYGQVGPVSVALTYVTACQLYERQCVVSCLDTMFVSIPTVWPVSGQQYVQISTPYSEYGGRQAEIAGQWGAI
jgi:hypothetical protein